MNEEKTRNKALPFFSGEGILVVLVIISVISMFLNKKPMADTVAEVPPYDDYVYAIINSNEPLFAEEEYIAKPFEYYSELDELGRCGYAMACISKDMLPKEERESISNVKPSGWVQAEYDFLEDGVLYNRCHLIGFQLTGQNDNEKNLITGTRYLNVEGMLPFENKIVDYIKKTGNHVLYRVTPVYEGNNLVASGVVLEAVSVEDLGEELYFHVYVYNVQPGVIIDYATGESYADPDYKG